MDNDMTIRTFAWKMNMGATAESSHRVGKNQFGDGYTQRFANGINTETKNWSGTKTGDLETVIKPILDFLSEHQGVYPFLWTDPHGNTGQYTCENYPVTQNKGNSWQIQLTFEQFN